MCLVHIHRTVPAAARAVTLMHLANEAGHLAWGNGLREREEIARLLAVGVAVASGLVSLAAKQDEGIAIGAVGHDVLDGSGSGLYTLYSSANNLRTKTVAAQRPGGVPSSPLPVCIQPGAAEGRAIAASQCARHSLAGRGASKTPAVTAPCW